MTENSPKQAPIRVIRRERPLDDPHFHFQTADWESPV